MKQESIGCEPSTTVGGLETEVKLADGGNSISWGFALGEFKTTTVLRIARDAPVRDRRPLRKIPKKPKQHFEGLI
jgi:hypothetical protein